MPTVGMRRTTRVFGVVKGADGARVLRSGRRLWLESSDGKLKKGGERDDWYSFVDTKASGKQIGWAKNVNLKGEIGATDSGDSADNRIADAKAVAIVEDGYAVEDHMFGIVYSRRGRKRKSSDVSDLDGKKYRIHFSRRSKRTKVEDISQEANIGFKGLAVVVKSASCSEDSGFGGFLCSILRYMRNMCLNMSELSRFLLEEPICGIYASRGVHFLWDPPLTFGSGICKFFGTRDDIPMFLVNFSAAPHCFRSILLDISLRNHPMPWPCVDNFVDEQTDSDDEDELLTSCLPSNTKPDDETPAGRLVLHLPLRKLKSDCRSAQSRHGLHSRGVRKTRSTFKSRQARNPSLAGLNKNNGSLASDLVSAKRNGFQFSSVVSSRKVRRSGRRRPAGGVSNISTAATELMVSQDIELTACSVNLLIIESDKCFREEGATVQLEPFASGDWCLAVKRDGLMRYTIKANETMKPSILNRFTHATVWIGDNGWRLEFLNRVDWLKFKDLYKECFDRNKQVVSPTAAAAVKTIPVPGVREVPDYEDASLSAFSRPTSYITVGSDEVSRALMKRTANYDMDSEDEEWLRKFNSEQQPLANDLWEDLKEESFELMIDAFEKAYYYNPHDFSNEKLNGDICVDLGRSEVVEAVYSYWMKKRKHKCSSLVRTLQVNQPRKAPVVPNPGLRKKRSFKRQASHRGRGKQSGLLQALAAERDALREKKSLQKLEEVVASISRSLERAVSKRRKAQFLMRNADLAVYRATKILRISEAADAAGSPGSVTAHFID